MFVCAWSTAKYVCIACEQLPFEVASYGGMVLGSGINRTMYLGKKGSFYRESHCLYWWILVFWLYEKRLASALVCSLLRTGKFYFPYLVYGRPFPAKFAVISISNQFCENWYREACVSRRPKPKFLEEQGGLAAASGSPDKNENFAGQQNWAGSRCSPVVRQATGCGASNRR